MRLTCPLCGDRDRREFTYYGAAVMLARPSPEAPVEAWADWLHLRDNPAGVTQDLWYHEQGCASWLKVTRDTVSHAVIAVEEVAPVGASGPVVPAEAGPAPVSFEDPPPEPPKPRKRRKSTEAGDAG